MIIVGHFFIYNMYFYTFIEFWFCLGGSQFVHRWEPNRYYIVGPGWNWEEEVVPGFSKSSIYRSEGLLPDVLHRLTQDWRARVYVCVCMRARGRVRARVCVGGIRRVPVCICGRVFEWSTLTFKPWVEWGDSFMFSLWADDLRIRQRKTFSSPHFCKQSRLGVKLGQRKRFQIRQGLDWHKIKCHRDWVFARTGIIQLIMPNDNFYLSLSFRN